MGWNGTFLLVSEPAGGILRVAEAIERNLVDSGATLVDRAPLTIEAWRAEPRLLGIAIAPPVAGWIAVTDTERAPDAMLAAALAPALNTPVVISTIVEICDPLEPEHVTVFGAPHDDRFMNLYERCGFRYAELVAPEAAGFARSDVVFLTVRTRSVRAHYLDHSMVLEDGDLPF